MTQALLASPPFACPDDRGTLAWDSDHLRCQRCARIFVRDARGFWGLWPTGLSDLERQIVARDTHDYQSDAMRRATSDRFAARIESTFDELLVGAHRRLLGAHVRGARVLDVGCGDGRMLP